MSFAQETALIQAAKEGRAAAAQELCAHDRRQIDPTNELGSNALHYAVSQRQADVVSPAGRHEHMLWPIVITT